MTKMNSTRCSSRGIVLLVLAVAVVGLAGTAAAVSVSETSVPDTAEVNSSQTATVTLSDLYSDGAPSEWTLRMESNLSGTVDWTVSKEKFGNAGIQNESSSGQSYETTVSQSDDDETVVVTVSGTVPMPDEWSYSPPQQVAAVTLYRVNDAGNRVELGTATVQPYTQASQNARQAIAAAQQAINDTSGDTSEAERSLEQAISAYNNENFENALSNAQDAQNAAESTQSSQQTTQLLLYGAIGVVVLLLVGGGVYYYRSQQDSYDKLR